eukprot:SAG11_NODE_4753_length_1779_cov_17.628571_2_plen_159_part_01
MRAGPPYKGCNRRSGTGFTVRAMAVQAVPPFAVLAQDHGAPTWIDDEYEGRYIGNDLSALNCTYWVKTTNLKVVSRRLSTLTQRLQQSTMASPEIPKTVVYCSDAPPYRSRTKWVERNESNGLGCSVSVVVSIALMPLHACISPLGSLRSSAERAAHGG